MLSGAAFTLYAACMEISNSTQPFLMLAKPVTTYNGLLKERILGKKPRAKYINPFRNAPI